MFGRPAVTYCNRVGVKGRMDGIFAAARASFPYHLGSYGYHMRGRNLMVVSIFCLQCLEVSFLYRPNEQSLLVELKYRGGNETTGSTMTRGSHGDEHCTK